MGGTDFVTTLPAVKTTPRLIETRGILISARAKTVDHNGNRSGPTKGQVIHGVFFIVSNSNRSDRRPPYPNDVDNPNTTAFSLSSTAFKLNCGVYGRGRYERHSIIFLTCNKSIHDLEHPTTGSRLRLFQVLKQVEAKRAKDL